MSNFGISIKELEDLYVETYKESAKSFAALGEKVVCDAESLIVFPHPEELKSHIIALARTSAYHTVVLDGEW